jgi:hypothetical protein
MMAKLTAGPLSGKRVPARHRRGARGDAVHKTANVDSDDLYPVFVSAIAANYDSGFADMPTLTDLVEAIRPHPGVLPRLLTGR